MTSDPVASGAVAPTYPSNQGLQIRPLTPHLGAVLSGLTLSGQPDPATLKILRTALAEHLVLVIPDQDLSPAVLRDFVGHFGPHFLHHADEGVIFAEGLPEVLEMRKEPDGARLFGGSDWHADVTFQNPAAYLSVLQAVILPSVGGDTAFANGIAAFQALSLAYQDMLRGLKAVHSYDGPGRPPRPGHTATHPVVRRHPDTEKEGLYINRMFAIHFEGMNEAESRPMIDFLDRHMSRPEFTCRVTWQPGQVVMWDNRFTLHYPINDFSGQRRLLYRCTALES
ncbi:MAG: TauD/TfdA family dioxygenase [Pseudomonadota bacterium]